MTDKTTTIRIAVVTTSEGTIAIAQAPVAWAYVERTAKMGRECAVRRSIVTATVPLPEPAAEVEADSVEEVG